MVRSPKKGNNGSTGEIRVKITFDMPKDDHEWMQRYAEKVDLTVSQLLRRAVKNLRQSQKNVS